MNELLEVVSRCNSGSEPPGALHWQPLTAVPLESWERWLQTDFATGLLPHLGAVLSLAGRQHVREIIGLDLEYDQTLEMPLRTKSAQLGQNLLQRTPARGDRMFARLQQATRAGQTPGHYATVFACRAASFSIPARLVFLSYCWQELSWSLTDEEDLSGFLAAAAKVVNEFLSASPSYPRCQENA